VRLAEQSLAFRRQHHPSEKAMFDDLNSLLARKRLLKKLRKMQGMGQR
jgi:hypothetical protein